MITFDTSEAHREALAAGTIDVMMVQDSARMGYEAVRSLTETLAGRPAEKRIDLPARMVTIGGIDFPAKSLAIIGAALVLLLLIVVLVLVL